MTKSNTISKNKYVDFCREKMQAYQRQGYKPQESLEMLNAELESKGWPLNKYSTVTNYLYKQEAIIEL